MFVETIYSYNTSPRGAKCISLKTVQTIVKNSITLIHTYGELEK